MTEGAASVSLVIIIAVLGIGTAFGYLLLPRFIGRSRFLIPEGHQFIVDNMEIILVGQEEQYALKPLCVQHGLLTFGKGSPLALFKAGNEYYQSTWLWLKGDGDTDFVITIWGPDDTGLGYEIEGGRFHGGYKITILYMGEPKKTMQPITPGEEIHPGYIWFTLTLSNSTG